MLTQRSKYALRAVLMLAAQKPGELVLVADIAKKRKVPKKFLELILLDLKKRGLLFSRRGKNGGYRLARPASKITFGEIVRITDGPLAPLACASLTGYQRCNDCEDEKTCAIRRVMRGVRDATAAILDHTTLADAIGK
ncbi:MAG: Rrf2 family transcriptional regulator [Rhodospirillaceae bacterium]|nr:MAG: Rrf2 family transcriptional regulator [Rhodospirillaceae bacterium]